MLDVDDFRALFTGVLPGELIDEFAVEFNMVERERKVEIRALARALILAASTLDGGLQADALRAYLEMNVAGISRAAFYKRFDERLEQLMAKLAKHAMTHASTLEVDLRGILGGVTDWWIVDSETAKLRDGVKSELPGCGDYAAVLVHKTISVGTGAAIRYHFSPAKEHDSKHLDIDESWRGYGLLVDLGYASLARLADCKEHGVTSVICLKENWKSKVDHIARGSVTKTFLAGSDLDALIEDDVLVLDDKVIDMEVKIGPEGRELALRLVGIPPPKGHCFFLTNLPPRFGPWQVGDLYRIRWEVELSMKLDKSIHRLDESKATKVCSVKTMLHASLLASTITAIAVHNASPGNSSEARAGPRNRAVAPDAGSARAPQAGRPHRARIGNGGSRGGGEGPTWMGVPDVLRGSKKSPPGKSVKRDSHSKDLLK